MLIENIPKSSAELYQKLLSELKPNWNVEIIEEDYNLYRLDFSDEIRCSLHLDISHEQIHELYNEIIDMETDAYMNEDLLYKDPRYMNEKEKKEYAILKESEKRYKKYVPLESICNYCF